MTPLSFAVLALMVELVPPTEHAYLGESLEETAVRYETFADIIATVALDADEAPLEGLDRPRTALVLATVAARESFYREDVMSCRVRGLGGAVGPYQYQGPRSLACGTWRQATRWALAMLRESFARCSRLPLVDRASFYTDGACHREWMRSRVRVAPALRFTFVDGDAS